MPTMVPIVLAIEPDRRQAAHVAAVVRHRVGAELILADTTEGALDAIGTRVPDLVLVPALLSPQDDAALAAALRVIAAAAHVRTLTIPVFSSGTVSAESGGGLLARFRRGRAETSSVGCDPAVFAEQIKEYLREAAAERADLEADRLPLDAAAAPLPQTDETPAVDSPYAAPPAAAEPGVADLAYFESVLESHDVLPVIEASSAFEAPSPIVAMASESSSYAVPPERRPLPPQLEPEPEPEPERADVDAPTPEPVRLIAPIYTPRPVAREPIVRAAPPLEFAEAAAAEFGERAFIPASGRTEDRAIEAAAVEDESRRDEVAIELSDDITEAPAGKANDELYDGERVGVYTLSLDESLDRPADVVDTIEAFREFIEADSETIAVKSVDEAPAAKPATDPSWLSLGLRYTRQWPPMEGAVVHTRAPRVDRADARRDAAVVEAAAALASKGPNPPPARGDHLDWA